MKYLQRYSLLLFALVLCVGLFSVTAHAEEATPYHLSLSSTANGQILGRTIIVYPFDDVVTSSADYYTTGQDHQTVVTFLNMSFATDDGSCIIPKGYGAEVKIENGFWWYRVLETDYDQLQEVFSIRLESVSGQIYTIDEHNLTLKSGHLFDLSFNTGSIDEDIRKIHIVMRVEQSIWSAGSLVYSIFGEMEDSPYTFYNMSVDTEANKDSATMGFLQGIVNAIAELPVKIADLVIDGLLKFAVPDSDGLIENSNRWEELLSSRFGVVYQVGPILTDFWDGVMNADAVDTVVFPSATINFSDTSFSFGGYDVKVVPEGFEWLASSVKMIVGIVCTVLFVNGMRKRYDEIMGVE